VPPPEVPPPDAPGAFVSPVVPGGCRLVPLFVLLFCAKLLPADANSRQVAAKAAVVSFIDTSFIVVHRKTTRSASVPSLLIV
jgi:hypothetical protein